MKKLLVIGCLAISSLFATEFVVPDSGPVEVKKSEGIRGVLFPNVGIVVHKGSDLEKEIYSLLESKGLIKVIDDEPAQSISAEVKNVAQSMEPVAQKPQVKPIPTNACKGCHGQDWSKKALGKSAVVSEMSKEAIEKALLGYKTGTYGAQMKGVMVPQVSKFTDDELKTLAGQIAR